MQTNNGQRFYHPELDGLRFIAFLLVFIHNSPIVSTNRLINALHEYGWIGVDLFFCLSAFLITKLLITEHQQTGEINIRNFYIRRALRIWPLYFLYIAIAVFYIVLNTGWNITLLKHIAGLTTFTYDFVYLFLTYKTFAVFFHLWTISYEEQFYAIIPWVLRKIVRISKKTVRWYLIAIFIFGIFIRALLVYFNVLHPVIYMLPFTHFEAMLGGLAIGLGLFDGFFRNIQGWILILFGLISNTILFLLPNTYEIGWGLMITYPLVGIGMSLIVFSIHKSQNNLFSRILNTKIFIYLGKISFGLYIFHLICISLADQFLKISLGIGPEKQIMYSLLLVTIGLMATIVFSITSYRWIETPFLRLREHFSPIKSRPV